MAIMIEHQQTGGKHNVTAVLTNALAAQGVTAPHTHQPFSEAMILGIGGGLGAGYILWEFKAYDSATMVLGFRNRWNYNVDYITHTCQRLGVNITVQETTSRKAAAENLQAALAQGAPAIAWVDKAQLPYQQLPERLIAHISHVVGVYGLDDVSDTVLVDDLADGLIEIDAEVFAAARGRISSDKNRVMWLEPSGQIDLTAALHAGLADCVAHLGRDSESFSLPVYKKWAKMMTDSKNKKAWPVVFKERNGLYSTLRGIFEGIVLDSTEGAALRGLYADFLDEAAPIVDKPALQVAAAQYREAAACWDALAVMVLPESVPALKEAETLLVQRYALYRERNWEAMRPTSERLEVLQQELNGPHFPLDDAGIDSLFAEMQTQLEAIYEAEMQALTTLTEAIP